MSDVMTAIIMAILIAIIVLQCVILQKLEQVLKKTRTEDPPCSHKKTKKFGNAWVKRETCCLCGKILAEEWKQRAE